MLSYQNFCFSKKTNVIKAPSYTVRLYPKDKHISTITGVNFAYSTNNKPSKNHFCKIIHKSESLFRKNLTLYSSNIEFVTKKFINQAGSMDILNKHHVDIQCRLVSKHKNLIAWDKALAGSKATQQMNGCYKNFTYLSKGHRHNVDQAHLTTKYLIKRLIKNNQNIPITMVVIYLNLLCRVWPVFVALDGALFYNTGRFAQTMQVQYACRYMTAGASPQQRNKQLDFLWGLKSFIQKYNNGLSNIVLAPSVEIKRASTEPHNITNTRIKKRVLTKKLFYKKREVLFLRLSENNKGYVAGTSPQLSGSDEHTQNTLTITRLKIKDYSENSFVTIIRNLQRLWPKSRAFLLNLESVKCFCLRINKSSNYFGWGKDIASTGLFSNPYSKFFSIFSHLTKSEAFWGEAPDTYLSLWQLTKKKQNQNTLYAIFKKYWLILIFNTCSIKLKRLHQYPYSSSDMNKVTRSLPKGEKSNLHLIKKKCEVSLFGSEFLKIQDKSQRSLYSYLITKQVENVFTLLLGVKNENEQPKNWLSMTKGHRQKLNSLKTIKYRQQRTKHLCSYSEARIKSLYLLGCDTANWDCVISREKIDKIRFFKNNLTYKSFINMTCNNCKKKVSHFTLSMLKEHAWHFTTTGAKPQQPFLRELPTTKLDQNCFEVDKKSKKQLADKKLYFQTYYF